ncbi:hypothetical protein BZL30_2914 [Mycobacterium kansasii]|uniref:Uncharacterized protein n=1 Tax=Mycobacterium kansasii TaxID=1768 RepID=A0A1V3XJR8_MYCKA|nr:hypothetical protein BZL30_2914 [Mycobacterium kansasii]
MPIAVDGIPSPSVYMRDTHGKLSAARSAQSGEVEVTPATRFGGSQLR